MNVCHLYNNVTSSHHVQKILDAFEHGESIDINDIDSLSSYDVYIIELENPNNEISKKLIDLFKDSKSSLIYFIVSQNYNLILFQLSYKLKTKDIITNGQDTDKVIQNIISDLETLNTTTNIPEISEKKEIISRVKFLDLIKQELNYRDNNKVCLSAITVSFQNLNELLIDLTMLELEEQINNIIDYMYTLFEDEISFVQLDKDFYVILFRDLEFEEAKELSEEFHNAVLDNMSHDEYKFFIDIFVLGLDSLGLSEIISTLNNIKLKNLSYKQTQSDYIEHTSKNQNIISEEDVINDAFTNKAQVKLLNIYNGLVISTPSKIIKQTDDSIYVAFEQLQGVVMNIEQETILQSSTFLQDILATIKVINLKKKIAVLENFRFLSTNANSRKYARVTTSSNIAIAIHIDQTSVSGQILDLSIKSVAIKTKLTQRVSDMKGRNIKLTFNIPNYRFDDGYVQLQIDAKVIAVIDNNDESCKVVCDIDENQDGESIIKEYVYDRQKELIIEVKKMSNLI